jgi:hypothetical protein
LDKLREQRDSLQEQLDAERELTKKRQEELAADPDKPVSLGSRPESKEQLIAVCHEMDCLRKENTTQATEIKA